MLTLTTTVAAVLVALQSRDTLRLAVSIRPSGDPAAPVAMRVTLPAGRDTALMLELPT
jgi:hypothetical protein